MSPPPNRPPSRPPTSGAGRPSPRPATRPLVRPATRELPGARAVRPGGGRPGAPGTAEAPGIAEAELERRFDALEVKIEQWKVRYNRYFAGDPLQRLPPDPMRDEIEREMRQLRGNNMRRSVDHFRMSAIESRLSSYTEMFGRRVRAVEEGKVTRRQPTPAPAQASHDVESGVVVDTRCAPDAVEALFQGLAARNPRGATMDLDTFRGYLAKQVAQIQEKTGCEAVQFRLVTEEGKVKLKAKPMAGRSPSP